MHIFITGVTGYIGNNLAIKLAGEGNIIHALCRNVRTEVLKHPNIKIFSGDITDISSIQKAMDDCKQAYHLAAYARVWAKDPKIYYRLNVEGAKNVFDAARITSIQKNCVYINSRNTWSIGNKPVEESDERIGKPFTEYEISKTQAEALCRDYCNKYGMQVCTSLW